MMTPSQPPSNSQATGVQAVNRKIVEDKDIVREFLRVRDSYAKLATRIEARCRQVGRDFALRGNYQSRVKDKERFLGKLKRLRKDIATDEHPETAAEWIDRFGDLAGVRVLAYDEISRKQFVKALVDEFDGPTAGKPEVDEKDKHDPNQAQYYRSTHLQVFWPKDECVDDDENLQELACEIQVSSMLAHVWNEIEHDLVYKELSGTPSETEKNLLRVLGDLSLAGDHAIAELMQSTDRRQRASTDQFVDEHDFVARLREPLTPIDIGKGRIGQLLEVARQLGLDTPAKVKAVFDQATAATIKGEISAFNGGLAPGETGLRLDEDSSDYLAYLLAKIRKDEVIAAYPTGRGHGAPLRIVRIAKRLP